jgi:hypothetical protein
MWQTLNMAVSKWLMRKSFDEAAAKAEQIKIATKIKDAKNAGLFTPSQEKLRQELGLRGNQDLISQVHCQTCVCDNHRIKKVFRPSRQKLRLKLKF